MNQFVSRVNPFDLVKASDFSDLEIDQYWVDLAGEERLADLFKPTLSMPMLLLGGKGSGKTHLMRYFSSAVRKLHYDGNLYNAIRAEKFAGIYVRADGLNVGRFNGKGHADEQWTAIFSFYFELWLATHFLRVVQECLKYAPGNLNESEFVQAAKGLFNVSQPNEIVSILDLISHFVSLRKSIDHVVGNVATGRRDLSEIDICISPGSLVFDLPEVINQYTTDLHGILFVYMIDEIENFSAGQQRFLNSLIRYRRGPVSLKIGARLYGIRTKKTLGDAEEDIRQNAEYERVELDAWLRDHDGGYKRLAKELIGKRLEQSGFQLRNSDSPDLSSYFECLDAGNLNLYQTAALELVKKYDARGEERPYFREFRKCVSQYCELTPVARSVSFADEIVASLKFEKYPLLEKVNIYQFHKGWDSATDLVELARVIGTEARQFVTDGKKGAKSYFEAIDHFKSDFLAQLFKDCGKHHIVYAGLETLIHLSQGIPRNLLGLLKHIYRRAYFAEERPFQNGHRISIASQGEGVRDAASWFWDDAQPDSHGPEARTAVQHLAELFSAVRYSYKPAECDLASFTLASDAGTPSARAILEHAENWSYLIRISGGGSDRNNAAAIDDKYQLSPMLAPRWEVSEHRRGAIRLNEELFNALFDPNSADKLPMLMKERLRGMQEPFRRKGSVNEKQASIFGRTE